MFEKIKLYFKNYYKKRKPFAIATDILFWGFILLLIIPTTRVTVSSFFIRLTSFAPSGLSAEKQYTISDNTKKWELTDMSGKPVLFSDLMDKPVFVNEWATWCPPCRAELPGIQKLYEQYKDKVNFLLLSDEPPAKIKAFALEHHYGDMPFYRYRNVPQDFSTRSIPTTFIISKKGKVVLTKKGAARWDSGKVKKLLDKLIRQ
jgi:thiol-disulfide isomerase/thioredoxin